jgi:hypothetical protein
MVGIRQRRPRFFSPNMPTSLFSFLIKIGMLSFNNASAK